MGVSPFSISCCQIWHKSDTKLDLCGLHVDGLSPGTAVTRGFLDGGLIPVTRIDDLCQIFRI